MRPETLQQALTQEQRDAGLYLEEPDDHILVLKRGDQVLARFSQEGTSKGSIQREAQKHVRPE